MKEHTLFHHFRGGLSIGGRRYNVTYNVQTNSNEVTCEGETVATFAYTLEAYRYLAGLVALDKNAQDTDWRQLLDETK